MGLLALGHREPTYRLSLWSLPHVDTNINSRIITVWADNPVGQ